MIAKFHFNFRLLLIIAALYSGDNLHANTHKTASFQTNKASNLFIRVLLDEQFAQEKTFHTITTSQGFSLVSPAGTEKKHFLRANTLNIMVNKNIIYLMDQQGKFHRVNNNSLMVTPLDGFLHFDTHSYEGTLLITVDETNNKLLLINHVSLDDYVYAVLKCEILSHWPLEIQKVQAIASRTYALYQMRQARKSEIKRPYDIKNTNFHQVYNGSHRYRHLREAVEQTHNMVLTYKNHLALTMFDICCGGVIPHHMKNRDEKKPYLYRKNRCTFCRSKSFFQWQESLSTKDFLAKLKVVNKKLFKSIPTIQKIWVESKDEAGIVQQIKIKTPRKTFDLPLKDFKQCLDNKLKSFVFSLETIQGTLKISGSGYGHNLGLCQLGARELVNRGWNFKKILSFYYPETKIRQLR